MVISSVSRFKRYKHVGQSQIRHKIVKFTVKSKTAAYKRTKFQNFVMHINNRCTMYMQKYAYIDAQIVLVGMTLEK